MDEVEEALFFQREWDSFFVDVFGDPVAATSISLLVELGIKPSDLFEMARSIDNKVLDPGDYRHKKETLSAPDTNYQEEVVDVFDEIHGIIEEIDALGANPQYQYALADQDALAQLVSSLVDAGARLREALSSSEPSLAFLYLSSRVAPYFPTAKPGNKGKAANWGGAPQKNAVVEMIREIQDRRQGVVEKITEALCENVFSVLCGFVIELRLARRRGGKITFGDQLNLCLELLRDAPPQLVCEIRNSYSVIMVDEFQDTDPVQLEIVKRLSGTFERSIDAQEKTPLAPLFFVGDPRQSIYRFRGADLDGYLLVARSTSAESRVDLNVNFRSNEEIVNWVNDSFEDYFAITSGLPASPLHLCDSEATDMSPLAY
ncbi:DNA helicase, UvrD/REP type [mine drainage metagenome]|uniref:DNA helicase, UvrD/REP type n=1 Tax=mine drainage metagenome TaxID=410659 RepID=T1B661_9ZZZZ